MTSRTIRTVLHLIAPAYFGGAERVVLNLVDSIDTMRFNVIIGMFVNEHFPENEFLDRVRKKSLTTRIFWLKRTFDVDNIPRLVKFIRSEDVALIHTHGYRSDILGLVAARLSGRPVVATIHGFVPNDTRVRFYERADRIALRFFDRVFPVSDQIGNYLKLCGIRDEKIQIIRNAIPVNDNAGTVTASSLHKPEGDFLIGVVGRLSPEKNIPGFLEVARKLSGKYERFRFVIVGDGPERNCLEGLTMKLELSGKVQFTGFLTDMEEVYAALDMLVISSSMEGIPLTALEAMRHGIPVVSTRVGGVPEVIDHEVNGLIVDAGDMDALSRAIETLVIDNDKYMTISRNAREKIRREFNSSSWINKIQESYESVLRKRRETLRG